MQDVHNVQICGVYPDCKTTHIVRVIIEEGATWRRRNFHVVFLDQFFMGNKNI